MKSASMMLSTGSRYQKERLTLISAWDIMMDMANTVEMRVLMTVGGGQVICLFGVGRRSAAGFGFVRGIVEMLVSIFVEVEPKLMDKKD